MFGVYSLIILNLSNYAGWEEHKGKIEVFRSLLMRMVQANEITIKFCCLTVQSLSDLSTKLARLLAKRVLIAELEALKKAGAWGR